MKNKLKKPTSVKITDIPKFCQHHDWISSNFSDQKVCRTCGFLEPVPRFTGVVLKSGQNINLSTQEQEHLPSTAYSRMHADVMAILKVTQEQNQHTHALNVAMGEFKEKLIVPLKEELAALRYNMGAKVEQTTTELSVFVTHLDKLLKLMLKAQGWSDNKIDNYREQFGLNSVDVPRAAEFNAYAAQVKELSDRCAMFADQNERLLRQIKRLKIKKKRKSHG